MLGMLGMLGNGEYKAVPGYCQHQNSFQMQPRMYISILILICSLIERSMRVVSNFSRTRNET